MLELPGYAERAPNNIRFLVCFLVFSFVKQASSLKSLVRNENIKHESMWRREKRTGNVFDAMHTYLRQERRDGQAM